MLPGTYVRCMSGHYFACVRGDEECPTCEQITKLEGRLTQAKKWQDLTIALDAKARVVIKELKAEAEEYEHLFELRQKADMRAIKRWQEATGRTMVLPDHADLCVWLMEQLDALGALRTA